MRTHLIRFLFLMLIILVISGCGQGESNDSNNSENVAQEAMKHEIYETPQFELKEKVEQLGNEAITEELDTDILVFEDKGYTYVAQPIYDESDEFFTFSVSVLKDDKWIARNVETDLSDQIYKKNEYSYSPSIRMIYKDTAFFVESEFTLYTNDNEWMGRLYNLHKITFNKDGVATAKELYSKQKTSFDYYLSYTSALNQYNYIVCDATDKTYEIYNEDNQNPYYVPYEIGFGAFPNPNNVIGGPTLSMPHRFSTIINDTLYYSDKAYDLKKNDKIWNEDGSEREFSVSPEGDMIWNVDNGFYQLNRDTSTLSYFEIDDVEPLIVDSIEIPSSLNIENAYLTVDKKNVTVHTLVIYKDQPTIQKYVFPRIDR